MNINRGAILCFSYILGLFLTVLWGGVNDSPTVFQWVSIIVAIATSTGLAMWILPRHFFQLRPSLLLISGAIALLAVCYFQVRTPRLATNSLFQLTQTETALLKYPLTISGEILTHPRTTSSGKKSIWLRTDNITTKYEQFSIREKLYISLDTNLPNLKAGDKMTLYGRLSQMKSPNNPWTFDFAKYLQKNNIFFRFNGREILSFKSKKIGISKVRERIVNVHQRFLEPTKASLLSAIVLGRKVVDVPQEISSLWIDAGLAHTIAASGFHVSLLLGFVQWLTKKSTGKIQFYIGVAVLGFYVLLTGFQPSILRAALMGTAGLMAVVVDRKVKPLGLLILVATCLLLYNPLWIWDLGFQLSFLATFGLLTTLQPIKKKLDFLPPTVAMAIAIPIAASLWLYPLLAYEFNVIATYSIPLNILFSVPMAIVSLGGILSGAIGLLIPDLGGAIAYLLGYPLEMMIRLVRVVVTLPGSRLFLASLHWSHLVIIYGVMFIIWLTTWGKKYSRTWVICLLIFFVVSLKIRHFSTTHITFFTQGNNPILVAQSKGNSLVFDSTTSAPKNSSLPVILESLSIRNIDVLINPESKEETSSISAFEESYKNERKYIIPVSQKKQTSSLNFLPPFSQKKMGDIRFQLLQEKPFLLEFRLFDNIFYLLGDRQPDDPPLLEFYKGYLITSAKNIDRELWETIRPKGAIAIGSRADHFLAANSIVYWTEEDGVIQWTPKQGLISVAPK